MYLSRLANTSPTASISLAALIAPVSSNSASYRDTFERRSRIDDREFSDCSFIANFPAESEYQAAAPESDLAPLFVSPHYYYPTDKGWKFEAALEVLMHDIGMLDRQGALSLENIGAVALSQWRPAGAATECLTVAGHKECGIAVDAAHTLGAASRRNVTCSPESTSTR